ncbi:hypothetical protein VQ03_21505 [Methylobacterium tarhaniae]|uniref:Uncharacterized protein n=1 Tax=Methylobacterium tarhaniae TaxID=1187852 RepID=A0A0J6SK38_9HYPH|nr:hypothetical protein VQ03_21505 [Methylobacterium tarhaniae]
MAQVVLQGAPVADPGGEDRLEEPVHAPSVALGAVERGVGVVEQGLAVLRVGRAERDADAGRQDRPAAGPGVPLADHPQDLLGDPAGLGLVDLRQEDRELVAAQARHHLPRPQHRRDPARQGLQQAVAHGVAVEVVDVLEPVEVEAHHRHPPPGGLRQRDLLVQAGAEGRPVRQAGQGVVVG